MAQGRKYLTVTDINQAISILTKDLAVIENEMILAWRQDKKNISKRYSKQYENNISELAHRLRRISTNLYNETDFDVRSAAKIKKVVPDSYSTATENFANIIAQNVLYQGSVEHAVAVFERWLYVAKTAFHQHDLLSSSFIIFGLSRADQGDIVSSKLSVESKATYDYYSSLLKADSLYPRQEELFKQKIDVLPGLHVLSSLHAKFDHGVQDEEESETDYRKEVEARRRTVSKDFFIKKKKKSVKLDFADDQLLTSLYEPVGDEFDQDMTICFQNMKAKSNFHHHKKVFSITKFSHLEDLRIKFIMLWSRVVRIKNNYSHDINMMLDKVSRAMNNMGLTDSEMNGKIYTEFSIPKVTLNRELKALRKKILSVLKKIIRIEKEHATYFNEEDLQLTLPKKVVTKETENEMKLVGKSETQFKELSGSLSESLSRSDTELTEIHGSSSESFEESDEQEAESSEKPSSSPMPTKNKPAPSIKAPSTVLILKRLPIRRGDTPRGDDSPYTPKEVIDELNALRSARSGTEALETYRKLIGQTSPHEEVSEERAASTSNRVWIKSSK